MPTPTLRRRSRYRISGMAPADYVTTADDGLRDAQVDATFSGLWRDAAGVYALFEKDGGGNLAVPLASMDRYRIHPLGA